MITTGGLELRVVPTPGPHRRLALLPPARRPAVLTGDTVLGRGTTVVAHPDGRLGDYLDSLRRLRSLTVDDGVHTVLPGHGPVLETRRAPSSSTSPTAPTASPRSRRPSRTAAAARPRWWRSVYADVDRSLWPAAELSVRAQLDYLEEHGLI